LKTFFPLVNSISKSSGTFSIISFKTLISNIAMITNVVLIST